ncbi:hypothetical protein [Paraburkholderia fungorum]|uniref:Uncharacterized protein n=1 Tax=Paraburkholderia fungorum TaxID=134537 RepID=A0A420GJN4_9BURK|nr:hypothetical protein [Paraburkholderia fungorum]RKF45356.1 hypothetical protein BCY88_26945 [Paraburkholderia fungorum]
MLDLSWVNGLAGLKDANQIDSDERYPLAGRQNSSIFIWHVICFFDSFYGARGRRKAAAQPMGKGWKRRTRF